MNEKKINKIGPSGAKKGSKFDANPHTLFNNQAAKWVGKSITEEAMASVLGGVVDFDSGDDEQRA